ncbi:type II toxin-antitoxin system RelE/ParE family toxin [Streptomyces sp. NPDC058434]|uniref:type II toxin-antitoxin system RelE/ParE family toxin n=1 Tax=Streptomyces sp. NPDC058434 TaxID=3346498 RepID=UPI00365B2380
MGQWEVILVEEVATWFEELAEADWGSAEQVEDAVDALSMFGPTLGRPLVDRIKGAEQHHLKELRPGSSGTSEIRILFARPGPPRGSSGSRRQERQLAGLVRHQRAACREAI